MGVENSEGHLGQRRASHAPVHLGKSADDGNSVL
jgi:hypothetical protein